MKNGLLYLVLGLFVVALSSESLIAQTTVKIGVYATGNVLEVRAMPVGGSFAAQFFSGFNITLRWETTYEITPSEATNILGSFSATPGISKQGGVTTDGIYSYQVYGAVPVGPTITWTQDTEYPMFTVAITGNTGSGTFGIENDAYTAANFVDYYFEVGGLDKTDYSPTAFYQGTQVAALPVQMTNFTAAMDYRNAVLEWSTATETNNKGFEIERRDVGVSGSVWTKVGFVQGAGTSTAPRKYSYTDASLAPGRYAYQIKQVDNDGKSAYSGSLEVEVGVADKVLSLGDNYPNPFNPSTSVEFSVPADGKVVLKVFNVLGQEVATLFDGIADAGRFHQARFDASSLPTGLYFSRLEYDGKSMMKKMLLTK